MNNWGKTIALLLVALFFTSLVTLSSAVPVHAAALSWNVQTVDGNAVYGGDCPLAVDSNNVTHIAYSQLTNDEKYSIQYASWNGTGFNTQAIDTVEGSVYSLVLDANDNPHVLYSHSFESYNQAFINELIIATLNGGSWVRQDTGINARYAVLALDSSGNPHIAYTDDKTVKYASWTGTTWTNQIVDTYASIPRSLFLSFDSHDTPKILYAFTRSITLVQDMGWNYENLKLASFENSGWDIQNFTLNVNDFGDMVLDSKGFPHFICQEFFPITTGGGNSTLFYASWNGVVWNTEPVISNTALNSIGSLTLDSNGNPHICYVIPAPNGETKMLYASWTGKAWNTQTVENISASGPCYLALDVSGNPHISSIGDSFYWIATLKYAAATEATQTPPPSIPDYAILSLISAGIIVAVAAVFYVWKKKIKMHAE